MILHCGGSTKKLAGGKGMAKHISTEVRKHIYEVVAELFKSLPNMHTLDDAEELAEEVRQLVGEIILEKSLIGMTGKATYKGPRLACECGGTMRFVGYRKRWVKAMVGETQIERAYYHCCACHCGIFPWDAEQGLTSKVGTPRFKGSVCYVMGVNTYSHGIGVISRLCDVIIEESSAEAIVLEVGANIRAKEKARVEQVKAQIERETAERLMVETPDCAPETPLELRPIVGKRIYLGVDAATAHIGGGWHNVQNGIVFTVKQDDEGKDTLFKRAYTAGQMDMETLGWRMRTLAAVWQERAYLERVFLGDGAHCNWELASLHFPNAIMILDFWHASGYIWALARKLYRQDDPKQKALGDKWAAQRLHSLKHEGPAPLLRALKRRKVKTEEQREALRTATVYFRNNRNRMDYPAHVAAGRMIGSGPVEAACKSCVECRLKGTGMRWAVDGADTILAVRTTILNGDDGRLSELARAALNATAIGQRSTVRVA